MRKMTLAAFVTLLLGVGLSTCASGGPMRPVFQSRSVADLSIVGSWGTNPNLETTTLVTFEPDGSALVRHLPTARGMLEGPVRYQVDQNGNGLLAGMPFHFTVREAELELALAGASGLTFLNRLGPAPDLPPVDELGRQLVDADLAGVWIFQGEGKGWASNLAAWRDSSMIIDPVAHKIRYFWRGANEGRQTWKSEQLAVEGDLLTLKPGEIVYKVLYDRQGKGTGQTVTVLYRFVDDQLQWIWAAPGAESFQDYVVYRRTRP